MLRVWLTITSLNLNYEIEVPAETTIGELAEWINLRIIRPLAQPTNRSAYIDVFREAQLEHLRLAEMRHPKALLANNTKVSELLFESIPPFARWSWIAALIVMIATVVLIGPKPDVNGKLKQNGVGEILLCEGLR